MKTEVDYIVVGQGLAGTIICSVLENRGRSFVVFDQGHQNTSSSIAAGIINPITGRRFVKSWLFDDLLDQAKITYAQLEKKLEITMLSQRNIIRQIPDFKAQNDWLAKASQPDFAKYVVSKSDLTALRDFIDIAGIWCEVTRCYQLDIPALIKAYRKYLSDCRILYDQLFDNEQLETHDMSCTYQQISSKYVIFCEGYRLLENPLFPGDFVNPSKGEVLLLQIPNYQPTLNVKRKFFLVPWKGNLFWFGAKDGWDFTDNKPSGDAFKILADHANKMIKTSFEIVDHLSAIRPTIKDRRPVVGRHKEHDRIFLFNGLGTKGASLAPYWAEKLIALIEDGQPLDQTVLYSRF